MQVQVFSSKHAENRLSQRHHVASFKSVLPYKNVKLYRDKFDKRKFYYNLDDGFVVLMKVGINRYLIKTITKRGQIDDRNFILLKEVNIVEHRRD